MMADIIEAEYREILPERLNIIAAEIHTLSQTVFFGIIEIGRRFAEAKRICPHGEWGSWVTEVTGYKQSMAENYIKVFNEYGGGQLNLGGDFTKSQSFANLGITKLLELTAIPADEREAFVKENDAERKTVRELHELIELERKKNAQSAQTRISLENRIEEKEAEAERLKTEAVMYLRQISGLEAQLKAAEDYKPEIPQSELDRFRLEAEEQARAEMKEELDKLNRKAESHHRKLEKTEEEYKKLRDKLDKATTDKKATEQALENSLREQHRIIDTKKDLQSKLDAETEENNRLRKELDNMKRAAASSGASEDLVRISVMFQTVQNNVQELMELIGSVEGAEKYHDAVVGTIQSLLEVSG